MLNLLIIGSVVLGSLRLLFLGLGWLLDRLAVSSFKKQQATLLDYLITESPITFSRNQTPKYILKIKYTYEFNGSKYVSFRVNSYNTLIRPKQEIEDMLEDIIVADKTIEVYVCPYFPSYAVIFPMKFSKEQMVIEIFMIFVLGLSLYAFYVFYFS